jgi:hypothetical protein
MFHKALGNLVMAFRNKLVFIALTMILPATPIFAQQTTVDFDHTVSFARYHTYSWHRVQMTDPLFVQRLKDAVDRDLKAKGWQMVPSDGDISIAAVGATRHRREYTTFYNGIGPFGWRRGWGGGGFGESVTSVEQVKIGTLILDMYDTAAKQLVWRGIATETLSDKPEKNTEKLNKAVDKLLSKFPPKGAQ